LIGLLITFAAALISAAFSYFTKKFYIKGGNLVFIHGIFNRETTSVPLDKIHSLRTKKGIWYRLLDMRGIVFDTLASRDAEIELILDEYDWKRLLKVIEKEEKPQPFSSTEPPEYNPTQTVRFHTKDLLLAALCQNHLKGMAVLGSFFALIFNNLSELSEDTTDNLANFLDSYKETLIYSPLKLIIFLSVIYIIILILWLGRVLLRYYDMTMSHDKKLLTFTYGMFTRASCRFYYDKVCTIRIKRNFLEKRFGFSTIMLRQALNASAKKEDDNMKLYCREYSSFFLHWWLGADYADSPDLISGRSGKGLFFRSIFLPAVISVATSAVLVNFQLYIWLLVPCLYLIYSLIRSRYVMNNSCISLRDSYFTIHNGAFAKTENYIKYQNIEVVKILRTPMTPGFHRVAIAISTSGTTFYVRSLPEEQAKLIYEILLLKIR
ncbi:MAG: PH domain-containing protein, partial [Muribaculaceae bacterium]|nr:PH domain-containing protein [Muribaculaceae bacterium]